MQDKPIAVLLEKLKADPKYNLVEGTDSKGTFYSFVGNKGLYFGRPQGQYVVAWLTPVVSVENL